ncbi:hypothetical protein [Acinetobacter sp. LA-1]|uniref:hypothetical protein n=1 Tax=Acinetobacter sp. LA-1 TaxID=3438431 RepID=UPI003F41AF9B
MRRFIEDFKMKNIAFFLLFFLLVSGHSNANPVGGSIGGWQVVSNVASGVGAKITATKDVLVNGAKSTVTGTANIMPDPSKMGKFMARLGGAAIVSEAVNQLLNGVDFVLDPANNSIVIKHPQDVNPKDSTTWPYLYSARDYNISPQYSPSALCKQIASNWAPHPNEKYSQCIPDGNVNYNFPISFQKVANPSFNPDKTTDEVRPITDVASQVLDQAEKDIRVGNPASPAVALSRAVAQDMIQEAEADDTKARPITTELDKNTSYPSDSDAEGEITTPEVTDPATGEVVKPAETSSIAMKFPKACEWFPQACLFIDWVMTDPNVDSDMEVPEKEIEKQEIKKDLVKISGRSCPSDVKFDVDGLPFGIKINKAYSMQEICNTVEPLKYVFELITAVICALILLRV